MKLMTLASGSSGNCSYIGTDRTSLLLDVGISLKNIEFGLKESGISPHDMDGILITHEHSDHIKCLGIISRKYNIPIYATAGTIAAIKNIKSLGEFVIQYLMMLRILYATHLKMVTARCLLQRILVYILMS